MSVFDVSVRYLLVELPLDPETGYSTHERIRNDVTQFLWDDPALVDVPNVSLIYPGDVVPGGVEDNQPDAVVLDLDANGYER